MKKILLSITLICLGFLSFAQNPLKAGDMAPNFTYADINSISHELYKYTDSGYTVIIDVSATWCGPCWAVHNSHVMDSLTKHYGTTGTIMPKKIKFFFFEGDATTPTSELSGGGSSQGDWITGTNYTILDQAGIKTQYPIDGYPHFYVICPNRVVAFSQAGYSAAMLTEAFWTPFMNTCPVKVTGTNAGTISVGTSPAVCVGTPTPLSAKIQNIGTLPLTSAVVNAKVGGSTVASYNWSGNLSTYDVANVNIGNYTFASGTTPVTYEVVATGDVLATDNTKIISSVGLTSNFKTWTLRVKTDQYPGDLSWKIKNSTGGIVQQHAYIVGPGTAGAGGPDAGLTFTYPLSLNANECYTIELVDSYGDGLYGVSAAADTGYVKLYDDMLYVNPLVNFGGGFDAGATAIVKTGSVTGVNDILASNISIYPNPTSSELNVKGIDGQATFTFFDVLGRTVKTLEMSNIVNIAKMNVSDLTKGSYILKITQEGKTATKSVVITE